MLPWLEDDDTPDPDALEQRCDAVTRAYLEARAAEIEAFRSPDPDPLDAFLDWCESAEANPPTAPSPAAAREVIVHTAPAMAIKNPGSDEGIRQECRKDLATAKKLGPRLTRHQIDEIYAELFAEAPWQAHVITWLWQCHLAVLDDPEGSFHLPPVLIIGPPGCGKTHLIGRLSELLALPSVRMDMSGSLEPWPIAGGAWGWRNAQPGIAVRTIMESGFANPMILLDETEKAGRGNHGSPLNALLPLLQAETARTYRCPYLEAEVDLSRVTWILLGNGLDRIPAPLLDRVQILRARGPEGPEVRQLSGSDRLGGRVGDR